MLYEGVSGLPHFNPDDDSDPLPGPVADLRSRIRTADAVVWSTRNMQERFPGPSRTSWTGPSAMTAPARFTRSPSPGSTSLPMVPSTSRVVAESPLLCQRRDHQRGLHRVARHPPDDR